MRFLLILLSLAAALAQPPQFAAKVDEIVNAHMKMGRFMGTVLAARGNQVLVSKGYGMANLELEVPNAPDIKFRLGSITKQFTAAAILKLEEAGKLAVGDKVCKFVDPCPANWQAITIHHLLTHTSGIHNYTAIPDYPKKMREPLTPLTLMDRYKDLPLDFEPGSKFSYSNSGYSLLGVVIEKASGEKYEDYLRKQIFSPLDMQDSGYDHTSAVMRRRASGYTPGRDGKFTNSAYQDMSQPYSAGSLYSTTLDLYRWDRALYGDKLLSAASRDKMFKPFLDNYAYGWMINKVGSHRMISHGGGISGFATALNRFPDDDFVVIALGNQDGAASGRIARDIAALYFGEPYEIPKQPVEVSVSPKILEGYAGKYKLGNVDFAVELRGNALWAAPGGNSFVQMFAETNTKFFLKVMDATFEFLPGDNGKASGFVFKPGGGPGQTAKRAE